MKQYRKNNKGEYNSAIFITADIKPFTKLLRTIQHF